MLRRDVLYRPCVAPTQAFAWAPTLIRDEMKYWLLKPDFRLRDEVRCYFIVEAERRCVPKHELHLPDGYSELVFTYREGFERAPIGCSFGTKPPSSQMNRSYVIGARSHSILTRDSGNFRVIGVKLTPGMLRRLVSTPLSEFRDSTLELRDLNHPALLNLEERLADACTPRCVTSVLDAFFFAQLRASAPTPSVVDRLLARIRAYRGAATIARCMQGLAADARTLERAFSVSVGMTPKKYARIVRFRHAYHALLTQPSRGRSRVRVHPQSFLDAYYDQSHFYKDFRFFTGTSPATLLANRTPASTAVTDHLLQDDLSAA